jgi:prepilin-type N-terminal cleavage/methylation domain-containing protein
MNRLNSRGFTIIELLIATVIFSVVLLTLSAAVVQVGRIYIKGITSANTQETARLIIDDISQSLQMSPGSISSINPVGADPNKSQGYCLDTKRYSFILGKQLESGRHGLVTDVIAGGCSSQPAQDLTAGLVTGSKELLSRHMRIANFDVSPVGDTQQKSIADSSFYEFTYNNLKPGTYPWEVSGTDGTNESGTITVQQDPCTPASPPPSSNVTVTSPGCVPTGMSNGVVKIKVTNNSGMGAADYKATLVGSAGSYQVTVRVVYGDDDLLCSPMTAGSNCDDNSQLDPTQISKATDLRCKNIRSGLQFCATSELSTIVKRRV